VVGRLLRGGSMRGAIDAGLAMIPESRKDQGLLLDRPVRENVSLPHLGRFSRAGVIRQGAERRSAAGMIEAAGIRGTSLETDARRVSGGNQQKLLFARWLLASPRVLIADEPTRGVDVGSKGNIYNLLVEMAAAGMGILMISSELEEVLGLAHRILVMRGGRIVGELDGTTATEAEVMAMAFGAVAA
jgi:ABC-type sugar transport system ATPase subunit